MLPSHRSLAVFGHKKWLVTFLMTVLVTFAQVTSRGRPGCRPPNRPYLAGASGHPPPDHAILRHPFQARASSHPAPRTGDQPVPCPAWKERREPRPTAVRRRRIRRAAALITANTLDVAGLGMPPPALRPPAGAGTARCRAFPRSGTSQGGRTFRCGPPVRTRQLVTIGTSGRRRCPSRGTRSPAPTRPAR